MSAFDFFCFEPFLSCQDRQKPVHVSVNLCLFEDLSAEYSDHAAQIMQVISDNPAHHGIKDFGLQLLQLRVDSGLPPGDDDVGFIVEGIEELSQRSVGYLLIGPTYHDELTPAFIERRLQADSL